MADVLNQAVNAAVDEKPSIKFDLEALVKSTSQKFIEMQLDRFPYYCYETRRLNAIKQQAMETAGNPGGWSEDKSFKFDYEIPRELYLFMQNLVYKNFWTEDNEKVWRSFMKAIMRGDDSMELLVKVKQYYGSNSDLSLTT